MHLTAADLNVLSTEPSGEARGVLAGKIAADYRAERFNDAEQAIANDIFRLLVKDTEKRVRKALAEQLAHAKEAPHDIILKLANDEADVAGPVLEYSAILSEDDLNAIIRSTQEVMKLRAIARRRHLSPPVADTLMATRNESVMKELFANQGAVLNEGRLLQTWNAIKDHPSLLETLVKRGGLPISVAEKLFASVSEELKRQLARQYKLAGPFVQKAAQDAREWEMLGIMPPEGGIDQDEQVEDLVDELYMNGRLTHSLLIRALCTGNMGVFEAGIGKLAGVPRVNARLLLLDQGGLGLSALYQASGMPEGFFEAVKILLKISLEESQYGRERGGDFKKRVFDRVYVGQYHRSIENMEYLLAIIGGKLAAAAAH